VKERDLIVAIFAETHPAIVKATSGFGFWLDAPDIGWACLKELS
jgi:hypothetical protein